MKNETGCFKVDKDDDPFLLKEEDIDKHRFRASLHHRTSFEI